MTGQQCVSGCAHRELATGWALHALEPAEEALVAAHLLDCAECARTIAETELVGAVVGLSVPEAIPSPELEQRVLAVTSMAQAASPPAPMLDLASSTLGSALSELEPASSTPHATGLSPPPQVPSWQRGQEPTCAPGTLVLVSIALLVFAFTFAVLFYAMP